MTASECPRLLVSVRSVDEALQAIAGGVEILDVKEPTHGSLGMAAIDEIARIASLRDLESRAIPLSVALGEVHDWTRLSRIPALPDGISFAKLGLAKCSLSSQWRVDLRNVRTRFESESSSQLHWVAVAYADHEQAQSPTVSEVLDEAIASECAGLLVDTFSKGEFHLLDVTDSETLTKLANDCHAAGLFFALAGKLRRDSLPRLAKVPADVIAIRTAACAESVRTSAIDSTLVSEFRNELGHCFRP